MLRLSSSLLFPKLIHQGEAKFKAGSDSQKTTDVYKLDWDPIDKIREDSWYKHVAKSSDHKFIGTLPEKYDQWVKDMRFALPTNYLKEIRRCSHLAAIEWGTERNFDTMIREVCLEPAIKYAYVAFRLLADCIYDEKTNYFYRGDDKVLSTQALLYKFWAYQTGRGLVQDHAGFHKIDWMVDESKLFSKYSLLTVKCECGESAYIAASSQGWQVDFPAGFTMTCSCGRQPISATPSTSTNDSTKSEIRKFIEAISEHERLLEEQCKTTDVSSGTGRKTVKEEQRPHVKPKTGEQELEDFFKITSGKAQISLQDFNIDIPGVGKTSFTDAKVYRMFLNEKAIKSLNLKTKGGETEVLSLKAEVSLDKPEKLSEKNESFSFSVPQAGKVFNFTAVIDKISGTPPIRVQLYIEKMTISPQLESKDSPIRIQKIGKITRKEIDSTLSQSGKEEDALVIKTIDPDKIHSSPFYYTARANSVAGVIQAGGIVKSVDAKKCTPIPDEEEPECEKFQFNTKDMLAAINIDELKDLNDTQKVLLHQWRNGWDSGLLNINCGTLHGIGKTDLLEKLIREYRLKISKDYKIGILIPNYFEPLGLIELKTSGIIDKIIHEPHDLSKIMGFEKGLIFADEVPGAERLFTDVPDLVFIAGFYSIHDERVPVDDPCLKEVMMAGTTGMEEASKAFRPKRKT